MDKAKQLGSEFSVGRVDADFRGILEDRSIDAVHVCTPNHLHFPVAKAALEAGKQVLCEKPLATSVSEAKALVAAAGQTGKRNCLCHNLRYYPAVQQMHAMRDAGELGEILVVQDTYSQDWLEEEFESTRPDQFLQSLTSNGRSLLRTKSTFLGGQLGGQLISR